MDEKQETNHHSPDNPIVFLDIEIDQMKAGRVIIELFVNVVPKTCENFRALCTGSGKSRSGKPLHYKGCSFTRVVPQFMVQGGDVTTNDGSGGESIYGKTFADENFLVTHTQEGRVGMANAGPDTSGSQFYITTVPCPHLDDRNVAFGQVRKGLNTVKELQGVPCVNDAPLLTCRIANCGELKANEPWGLEENDGTEDVFPEWPHDWDMDDPLLASKQQRLLDAIRKIKDSGNLYFNQKNYIDSYRKYKKTLRYIDHLTALDRKFTSSSLLADRFNSLLNLAAVQLRRGHFADAFTFANQALVVKSNSGKAFYRRAQARMGLKDYDNALRDFQAAQKLCPNDKTIIKEQQKANKIKQCYLQQEKRLFSRMFRPGC